VPVGLLNENTAKASSRLAGAVVCCCSACLSACCRSALVRAALAAASAASLVGITLPSAAYQVAWSRRAVLDVRWVIATLWLTDAVMLWPGRPERLANVHRTRATPSGTIATS